MPSFTMELWRVIDMKSDKVPEDEWLGLDAYPLHAGVDRDALNKKIKDHYMYQEIAHETVDQFRFAMRRKMNEIMPVYNELYKSVEAHMASDPLMTINMKTLTKGTQDQEASADSTSDTTGKTGSKSANLSSNYPQTGIAVNGKYGTSGGSAESATDTTGQMKEKSESQNKANSEGESSTTGYQGVPAQLITAYRQAIINVDMMIITELDNLFSFLWNNGDTYTETKGYYYGY